MLWRATLSQMMVSVLMNKTLLSKYPCIAKRNQNQIELQIQNNQAIGSRNSQLISIVFKNQQLINLIKIDFSQVQFQPFLIFIRVYLYSINNMPSVFRKAKNYRKILLISLFVISTMMMVENMLQKRYLFAGKIHTPRTGDISILSIDQKGQAHPYIIEDHHKNELQTSRQNIESQPEVEILQFHKQNQEIKSLVWRNKCFRILYFVSKFLTQLKHSSNSFKFKMLTKKIFDFINDSASDYQFYIQRGLITKNLSIVQQLVTRCKVIEQMFPRGLLKLIPVIYPDSYFRIIFDSFLVLSVILNIFFIPIRLAFTPQENENTASSLILELIPSWLLLIEIPINFNTAFYFNGIIHVKRRQIVKNYIKGQFFWDLMISFPFIIQQIQPSVLTYILLLRVARIKTKFDNIEKSLNLRERFPLLLDLGRLIYFVIVVSHFCACSWYQLAKWEEEKIGRSWLSQFGLLDQDLKSKYINSLYFCTITITTVGYGDITPVTPNEMIFTVFMTLVTCGVFGYAINNIGTIFQEIERKEQLYKNQMAKLSKHLKRHKVGQNLSLQIKKYYEYQLQKADEDDQEIVRYLDRLPQDLRVSLNIEKFQRILLRSKYLKENVSISCLNELCQKVIVMQYSTDDIIFERNQQTRSLYFIQAGEVNIVIQKQKDDRDHRSIYDPKDTILRRFKEGYVLGEKNFLLDMTTDYQAQANQRCTLLSIRFEDFISVLKTYPIDYERFCLMRDTLKLDQQYRRVVSVCEICAYNHGFTKCPFTFHQPNKYKIIQMDQKWEHHNRQPFGRREKKIIFDIQNMQYSALSLAIELGHVSEEELHPHLLQQFGIKISTLKTQSELAQYPSESLVGQSSASSKLNREKFSKQSLHQRDERRRSSKRKTAFLLVRTLLEKQSSSWRNLDDDIEIDLDFSPHKSQSKLKPSFSGQDEFITVEKNKKSNLDQNHDVGDEYSNRIILDDYQQTQTQGPTYGFEKSLKNANITFEIDSFRDFMLYKPEDNLSSLLWQLETNRQRARTQLAQSKLPKSQNYLLNKVLTRIKDVKRFSEDLSSASKRHLHHT